MIRRLLPLLVLSVSATACLDVPACASDADCPGGGACDTRFNLCVYGADAGGTGGGGGGDTDDAGTGGGGGADDAGTGGDGGADDAGTGGGGGTDDAGTGGGGADDAGADAGAPDAGAPDAGAPDAGAPDAGAPDAGAPDAGPTDAGPVCNPNQCSEWEACHPTLGACVQVAQVLLTSPPNAGSFGGPSMNPLRIAASVVAMDGGRAATLPGSLALTLTGPDGGSLTMPRLADGGFAVNRVFPPVEATYTARAGWPSGPDASVTFSVDFLAPMQSYVEPPSPPSGFKRDMLRPLLVRTHEAATLSATLQGTSNVVSLNAGTNFCANRGLTPAPNDTCVRLDFSAPDFDAVSGVMTLQTFATDTWGNQSMFAASYLVDRVRWRYAPNPTVLVNSIVAPALDSDGNLYLGYNVGAGGGVVSLDADGGSRFSIALGSIQGIAVGPRQVSGRSFDQVFVTYNENASGGPPVGYVGAFHANGSVVGLATPQTSGAGQPTWSAPGLYDAGLSMSGNVEIGAAAILSTTQGLFGTEVLGQLCVYFPNGGGVCDNGNAAYAQPEPALTGPLFSPLNLAIAGNTTYFQNTEPTLSWRILAGPNQKPGAGGSTPALGGSPTGLALSSSAIASATVSNGASLRTYARASPAAAQAELMGASAAMAPALAGGNTVSAFLGGGTSASWLRLAQFSDSSYPAFLGNSVNVGAPATGALTTSPVLGDRGFLYAVTLGGELRVYDANPGAFGMAAPKWSMTLFPGDPSPVMAHPNLDCNRRESGQPGTLYVVNRGGAVAAIIVDSRRLAQSAHWPRWQRTAGNAGNVDFPLNPGCP